MSTQNVIVIAIAVAAIALAFILFVQKQRSQRLRSQFGPEYDRLVKDQGSHKAEQELLNRQKRIEKLHVRELNQVEIDRFSNSWRAVQTQFVDSPRESVAQADRLIRDVMTTRGYPVTDFDQRAADISVEHPRVVDNYRAGRDIALRDAAGKATTEDLRQAMVHFRVLFEDLLSTRSTHLHEVTK